MKGILRLLYADPQADLGEFKDELVEAALKVLTDRFVREMTTPYRWFAACTVAVEAGRWGGERRRKRRVKLLDMINTVAERLDREPLVMEDRHWEMQGLHYGYGAYASWAAEAERAAQPLSLVHEDQR